jgi:hypothetical protein
MPVNPAEISRLWESSEPELLAALGDSLIGERVGFAPEDTARACYFVAHGSRFGGHALYIKDQRLKYVYNWVGEFEQIVESVEPIPIGRAVLSASFAKHGEAMPTEGTLTLHVGEQAVGEGQIKTQPSKFSLAGEGLDIGRDRAEPVTDDYPGDSPWRLVGGTIVQAAVDVSGEPFVDLANEARMAYARD